MLHCSSCGRTKPHDDFIKDGPKRTLLKTCRTCWQCVGYSLTDFTTADFFIELCDFIMTQDSCSDWFQCSIFSKMPAFYLKSGGSGECPPDMPNLWYKACVCSDQGVQGGVPLICQIFDIKLAFAHGVGGLISLSIPLGILLIILLSITTGISLSIADSEQDLYVASCSVL